MDSLLQFEQHIEKVNHHRMTLAQRLVVFVGFIVSLVFLWLAFRGLNPEAAWMYIQTLNVAWILIGVGSFFVSLVLIAARWGFVLRAIKPVPVGYLTELMSICYMGNNVYPLRTGEVLRVVLLQRDYKIPVAKTTTTIFIERMFDGLVMLSFIIVPLMFIEIASPELRTAIKYTAPMFLSAMALFLVLAARPEWLRAVIRFMSRLLPEPLAKLATHLGEDIIGGMGGLRNPRYLAAAIMGSIGTWMFNALVYWIVSFAFDLHVSFAVMMAICGVVNLAGAFPVSPGQVGVFEFLVSTVMIAVGTPKDQALAYALVVHVVIWMPVTLFGFVLLARRGLGLQAITHARELEGEQLSVVSGQ